MQENGIILLRTGACFWKLHNATTETYKNFMPCFVQHNMASTLTICFLHHCTTYTQRFWLQNLEGLVLKWKKLQL